MKMKNLALIICLLGFAVGFSDLQENIIFWLGRPVGAIFFIVYFIFAALEKESALYDAEHRLVSPKTNSEVPSADANASRDHADILAAGARS